MSYIKVYRVVCSIYENGKVVDVGLAKLLDRLDIRPTTTRWSEDYDLEYLVRYLVKSKLKVRYRHAETFIKPYEDYTLPAFYSLHEYGLGDTAEYMNRLQYTVIRNLSEAEVDRIFYKYGNDYTKQIKGERYL